MELAREDGALVLACDGMTLRGDFSRMLRRASPSAVSRELLVRAARVKGEAGALSAADATAGLGEDAFLLAAAGFLVTMFERNPVAAALLEDALARARTDPALAAIAARMRLVAGDSVHGLAELACAPDVVLLDPMFPQKRTDASAKKKLQMLQRLEGPCDDGEALLDAARSAALRKVVVKRPAGGPALAGRKPAYELRGKLVRFDCYLPARRP